MPGRLTAVTGHRLAIPASVGVLGLVLIGIGQVIPNRHTIQDDLATRSTKALKSADLGGLSVSFTGRDATITGSGDASLAEKAEDVVGAVNGVRVAKADFSGAVQADASDPTERPVAETPTAETSAPVQASTSVTTPAQAETVATTPALPVGFTLADGTITVTGTVLSTSAQTKLLDAVKASGNGWTVVGRLQVDGSLTADAEPELSRLSAVTHLLAQAPIDGTKLVIQYSRGSVILRGTLPDYDSEVALLTAATATVQDKSKVVDGLDAAG